MALDRQTIDAAGFKPPLHAVLDLTQIFSGPNDREMPLGTLLKHRPALLILADYRCQSLCGVIIDQLSDILENVPLVLGRDYNVVVVALDAHQTKADAQAFREQHAHGLLKSHGLFLTETEAARQSIASRVGLKAPFDAEHGQFVHPAGLVVVDAEGRLTRVLSPFALTPLDLTLALADGGGALTLATHALSLCYGWNASTGIYTLNVERILAFMAALTVLLTVAMIAIFLRQERKLRVLRLSKRDADT